MLYLRNRLKETAAVLLFSLISSAASFCQVTSANNSFTAIKDYFKFPVGASLDVDLLLKDQQYRKIAKEEFNSVTPENAMKMNRLSTGKTSFYWKPADTLVNFALRNNQRVHGHTLIWHYSIPTWVQEFKGDTMAWDNLLKDYIYAVVSHFKGKVGSWDVVNEAFEDNGEFRKTIWYQHLGEDYIAKSFKYASEADPSALLFYNDYGQEENEKKTIATIKMVNSLKQKKIPIHGLGLQTHINIQTSNAKMKKMVEEHVKTGLLIHFSEITVSVYIKGDPIVAVVPQSVIKKQMQKFSDMFYLYITSVPEKQQFGISTWNIGDKDSFMSIDCKCPAYPQMFDSDYNKKKYFDRVISAGRKSQLSP